jgi:hypothetical protein
MTTLLELRRDQVAPDCIMGILALGDHKLHTIEPPWIPNPAGGKAGAPFVSCVPPGLYRVEPYKRPCGERTWILSAPELGVFRLPWEIQGRRESFRSLVTIRAAHYAYDAVDAIGVGLSRTKDRAGWKLERSLDAMNQLRTLINGSFDVRLKIEESA